MKWTDKITLIFFFLALAAGLSNLDFAIPLYLSIPKILFWSGVGTIVDVWLPLTVIDFIFIKPFRH
jgi:hypothetical protein